MDNTTIENRFVDYLIGGVDQSKAGNGGPHCYTFRSDHRKVFETALLGSIMYLCWKFQSRKVIQNELSRQPSEFVQKSKQLILVLYCIMMGIQVGFKFATRTLIFYFQPCHIISTIQIYLLANPPSKYTSIIYRTHIGLLNGPLLALVFPVLDTYILPFEIEMYFIQHYAILLLPVYLYLLGEPYSGNLKMMYWALSYPIFIIYHMFFLQPLAIVSGVNVSTVLCPVSSDPFYGPNYVLHAAWHQAGKMVSPWAVKRVNKRHENTEYAARLEREAKVLKTLHHPNIIGFRGYTKTETGPKNLVMEDGHQSLNDLIEKRKEETLLQFPADDVEKMITGVASALDYLHNIKLIMHGDIKSANILVSEHFDVVKVCDFGVTLNVDKDGNQTDPDQEYIGTDAWSPMEVVMKSPIITTKADIFALGLTIFEMLALHPPHIDKLGGFDESLDDSLADDMEESFDDSEYQAALGTRPSLPDSLDLDNSYRKILEVFFSATCEFPDKRPSAQQIIDIMKNNEDGDDSVLCVNMVEASFDEFDESRNETIEISDSENDASKISIDHTESPAAV